jgi:hypothetical protein
MTVAGVDSMAAPATVHSADVSEVAAWLDDQGGEQDAPVRPNGVVALQVGGQLASYRRTR